MCHQFITSNPGRLVTRYQFSRVFNKAWMRSMTISNICTGFKITGVHPINRDVFAHVEESSLVKQSGLAFIPLYSPSPKRKVCDCGRFHDVSQETNDGTHRHYTRLFSEQSDPPPSMSVWLQSSQTSGVSRYLQCPSPLNRQINYHPKSCGRVLTSAENLAEKEKAKQEKEKMKAERKKLREERKHIRAAKGIKNVRKTCQHVLILCRYKRPSCSVRTTREW